MNTLTTSLGFSSLDFTNQFAVPHPPCSTGHAPPHFAYNSLLAPHGGHFHLSNSAPMSSASLPLLPFLSLLSLRYQFFQEENQSCFHPVTPPLAGLPEPPLPEAPSPAQNRHFWVIHSSGNTAASFFPKGHKPFWSVRLPSSSTSTFPSCNPGRQLFVEPAAGLLIPNEPPGALTPSAVNPVLSSSFGITN